MKRALLILICVVALCTSASAHSGRTDENGGHTDHSTGEYHYHHGYPAHQHKDMDGDGDKDCPYNFDDKTGWNSGTATGTGGSSTKTAEVIKEVEVVKEVEAIKEVPVVPKKSKIFTSILIVLVVIIGGALFDSIKNNAQSNKIANELRVKDQDNKRTIARLEEKVYQERVFVSQKNAEIEGYKATIKKLRHDLDEEELDAQLRRDLCNAWLASKLGDSYLLRLSDAPDHIELGKDNLPYSTAKRSVERWGHECSYYVADSAFKSGKGIYHRHDCPACNRKKNCPHELHFTTVIGHKNYAPCKICIPHAELPKWQREYIKAVEVFRVD